MFFCIYVCTGMCYSNLCSMTAVKCPRSAMGPFEFNGVQYVNKQERDLLIVAGWLDFLSIDNSEIGTVRNRDTSPPRTPTIYFAKNREFRKKKLANLSYRTEPHGGFSRTADAFAQNWTSKSV